MVMNYCFENFDFEEKILFYFENCNCVFTLVNIFEKIDKIFFNEKIILNFSENYLIWFFCKLVKKDKMDFSNKKTKIFNLMKNFILKNEKNIFVVFQIFIDIIISPNNKSIKNIIFYLKNILKLKKEYEIKFFTKKKHKSKFKKRNYKIKKYEKKI